MTPVYRDEWMSEFGELLREYRLRRNYSQGGVSRAVNYDQSLLSKVERGQRAPSPELLEGLVRALRLSREEAMLLRAAASTRPQRRTRLPRHHRELVRPLVFWFVAGCWFMLLPLILLGVRLIVVQGHVILVRELIGAGDLVSHAPSLFLLAVLLVVVSMPVGYLLHQVYIALYWVLGIRLQSTHLDRAQTVLSRLAERHRFVVSKRFPAVPPPAPTVRFRFGPAVLIGEMAQVRDNWNLLKRVWFDTLNRDRLEHLEDVVSSQEDALNLQGALIVASFGGWLLYAGYELAAHGADVSSGKFEYVLGILTGLIVVAVLVQLLRLARMLTAEDAFETRFHFLDQSYRKIEEETLARAEGSLPREEDDRPTATSLQTLS